MPQTVLHQRTLTYDEISEQRSLLILALLAARDELKRNDAVQAAKEADEVLEACKIKK